MAFLSRLRRPLESWFGRRSAALNTEAALRRAAWLAPLGFGLLSLLLGQDDNWDLKNYHLYNAYALLNGRVGFDMAPAQWQSYFNPALDLLYYGLVTHLPGPLAGFVMGALHGLNCVLVVAIARLSLAPLAAAERYRAPLLLGIAGCLGAGFLSELGNAMGDNMMALLVLAALYTVLRQWERLRAGGRGAVLAALGAGLLMGVGTGLKLTNATYALAMCLALLVLPAPFWRRLGLAFGFGLGVLAGIGASAGFWFLKMWQLFGNPLFPQFNSLFKSPLAQQLGVIDTNYVPKGWGEALLWPFIFTHNFRRVGELVLHQLVWPVVYLLFLALLVQCLRRRLPAAAADPRGRYVLVFFALSYLGWLKLFGIYRYLVPIELLAPLVIWLLAHRLLAAGAARRLAAWLVLIAALAVFPFVTWGHAPWSTASFSATVPAMARPQASIVFTAHGHPPMGWLVKFFPAPLRFISVGSGFPESPAYLERMRALISDRPGPHYALLYAHSNHEELTRQQKNRLVDALGLTASDAACARLGGLLARVRFHVDVVAAAPGAPVRCALVLQPKYRLDTEALDRQLLDGATRTLAAYRLALKPASCVRYQAAIGAEPYPYRLCAVEVLADQGHEAGSGLQGRPSE